MIIYGNYRTNTESFRNESIFDIETKFWFFVFWDNIELATMKVSLQIMMCIIMVVDNNDNIYWTAKITHIIA